MLMAASKDNTNLPLRLANREKRRNQQQTPDTPVREIRLLSTYEFPKKYKYLESYRDVIVRILQQKQFLCPGYSHIYISIGETEEDAIAATYESYDWFRFGIAVLKKEILLNTPVDQLEALMLTTISDGLHDIAELDHLDRHKIDEAIKLAGERGLFHERVINEKENGKYVFRILAKPLEGRMEEEIFFSLNDREKQQVYHWKFGELQQHFVEKWLFKLNVTNKLIRTKPRANMLQVLKGRKMELELNIEKIKEGSGQLTYEDTTAPVTQEIIDLEKKLGWRQPPDRA
jgi:hypothetical protein